MAELIVDTTYATALLEAARDRGVTERIAQEGEDIVELLRNEDDFRAFVNYPGISGEEKKNVLRNIFEGRVCPEMMNFLQVLVDKRRIGRLEEILKAYNKLMQQEEGVAYGTVQSVVPLDEVRLAQLEEQTGRLLDRKVSLTNETVPGLIAGVRIMVEGKVIDASYRKRFNEMASRMNISQGGIRK